MVAYLLTARVSELGLIVIASAADTQSELKLDI